MSAEERSEAARRAAAARWGARFDPLRDGDVAPLPLRALLREGTSFERHNGVLVQVIVEDGKRYERRVIATDDTCLVGLWFVRERD